MIHVKETVPHSSSFAQSENYGAQYQGIISPASARKLCGDYPLPKVGYETVVAHNRDYGARLYVANVGGVFVLRSSSVGVGHWPERFGVTLERFGGKMSNAAARQTLYDWHGGQGSPFYAAASSGLVASFELLAQECDEIGDGMTRARLLAWIEVQKERAPRVTVNRSQCFYYHALPWAEPIVVTLKRMRREVPTTRHGKPAYKWLPGYVVNNEFPPVGRAEAYQRAREIGGKNCKIKIED